MTQTDNKFVVQLKATSFYTALDTQSQQMAQESCQQVDLGAGEKLFQQGDESDALFVLLNGRMQAEITDADGNAQIVGQIEAGNLIGEMQILSGKPRTAAVRAIDSVTLAKVPRPVFDDIALQHPQFLKYMGQIIEERLRRNQLFAVLPKLFGPLDLPTLETIEAELDWLFLPRGEVLMHQGDVVEDFYILVNGRLLGSVTDGRGNPKVVGDIHPGESIGETQILTQGNSTVTIYAARDSEVVRFTKEEFDWLTTSYPTVMKHISINIAHELRRVVQGGGAAKRDRDLALDIVVVPTSPDIDITDFTRRLGDVVDNSGKTLILDSQRIDEMLAIPGIAQSAEDDPNNIRLVSWLNEQETLYKFALYQTDIAATNWTKRSIRQADHILIVGKAGTSPKLGQIEEEVLTEYNNISVPKSLILLYEPNQQPHNTKAWLDLRKVDRYQHVQIQDTRDYQRLARQLTGKSVGIVLGGGGARGFAHIGVLEAFKQAGVGIDIVGGTSMGSLIAGQVAMGWDYQTMIERSKAALPKSVLDYTFPLAALISGKRWTKLVEDLFGDVQIEDLWHTYFCVSCNLTLAEAIVHDTGPLWQATRTSSSIPGIIPPMINESGDLLVDGGVLENLPVQIMSERNGGGPIIASDVSAPVDLRTTARFGPYLSGWYLLWQRLNPYAPSKDIPSLGATIMRSSLLSSAQNLDAAKALSDLYLYPPVEGFGTLEFSALDDIIKIGFEHGCKMIEGWQGEGKMRKFIG